MKTKTTLAALLLAAVMVTPSYGSESLSRIEKEGEKRKALGIAACEKASKLIDKEIKFLIETITVTAIVPFFPDPANSLPITPWLYGKNVFQAVVEADEVSRAENFKVQVQFFVEDDEVTVVSVGGYKNRMSSEWTPYPPRHLYVKNKRLDELRAVLIDYTKNAYEFVNHTCRGNFRGRLPNWTGKNIKSRVKRFAPRMVSEVEAEMKSQDVDLLSINAALQELNTTPEDYWIDNVVLAWHYFANERL